MNDDRVAAAARAAAGELAAQYGSALAADVEAALCARDSDYRPERYFDPVALGSLIVSIASLGWTIYSGMKKSQQPTSEVLARQIRVVQRTRGDITGNQEKIIEVVATEIIRAAESDS